MSQQPTQTLQSQLNDPKYLKALASNSSSTSKAINVPASINRTFSETEEIYTSNATLRLLFPRLY